MSELDYSQFSGEVHWRGIMAVINTADAAGRKIVQSGRVPLARELPLSLRYKPADLPGHDGAVNIGSINKVWFEGNELWGQGRFDFADPVARDAARKIRNGFVRHMSADIEPGTFKLMATTVLDIPAFEQAQFTAVYIPDEVQKVMDEPARRELVAFAFRVVGDMDLPLADDLEREWDSSKAVQRVAEWASVDGELNPERFRRAFFYQDADSDPALRGSYKLPFADVIDGELVAVPRGIRAVAGVLQGARGGVDIPESDVVTIRRRVSAWYSRMADMFDDDSIVAPWDRPQEDMKASYAAETVEAAVLEEDPAEDARSFAAVVPALKARAAAAVAAWETAGVL